ncbi:unnamed protein product, partial [Brassica rapa subsp. narinosa]
MCVPLHNTIGGWIKTYRFKNRNATSRQLDNKLVSGESQFHSSSKDLSLYVSL